MKILIYFLLLTQLLPATIRKLDSINYRTQVGSTVALIKLSDESVWKWIPDTYSENMLRNWHEGDEILITTSNHPGFILHNKNHPLYCPTVALSFNSYTLYPSLKKYVEEEHILTLSDHTEWSLLYEFNKRTLSYWSPNDRIIPVKGENNEYELINIDIPYENRCQVERSIQVLKTP